MDKVIRNLVEKAHERVVNTVHTRPIDIITCEGTIDSSTQSGAFRGSCVHAVMRCSNSYIIAVFI